MIAARLAAPTDDEAVAELRELARAAVALQRGGPSLLEQSSSGATPHADVTTFVGCIDDVAVGYAVVSVDGDRALASELYVRDEARDVGVGHALLQAIIDHARSLGATHLDSYALPGDRDTKNFFESHAMKSRLLVVHQPL